MDSKLRTLIGVIGALLAALVVLTDALRRRNEQLRICGDEALVFGDKWSKCRDELRAARMLE